MRSSARARANVGEIVNRAGAIFDELIRLLEDPEVIPGRRRSSPLPSHSRRPGTSGAVVTVKGSAARGRPMSWLSSQHRSWSSCRQLSGQRTTALRAIAEQGEGLRSRPTRTRLALRPVPHCLPRVEGTRARATSRPRPLAPNPTTRRRRGRPGRHDHPDHDHPSRSAAVGALFNVRYRKLLVNLSHAFELTNDTIRSRTTIAPRGGLIHRTFAEMYNLRAIAGLLVRLPARMDDEDGPRAGPPFQMPYTLALPSARGRPMAGASGPAGRFRPAAAACVLGASRRATGRDYLFALTEWDQVERRQVDSSSPCPRLSRRADAMIRELRILPPLAIARFGARPPRWTTTTRTSIRNALSVTGSCVRRRRSRSTRRPGGSRRSFVPVAVTFTENGLARPVAPFLEAWALTDDDVLEPLTRTLLAANRHRSVSAVAGRRGQPEGVSSNQPRS